MESTFIEGVKSQNPIIKAIAVKALHYRDLSGMHWGGTNNNVQLRDKHKYDVLTELWNEIHE